MKLVEPSKELDDIAHQIIGSAIEVHRHLGAGYLESLYEEALCLELEMRNITYQRQAPIGVSYKGHSIGEGRIDILVENCVIVELKAVESILPIHKAQVMSYLKAKNLNLGLLINFNVVILKDGVKRIIRSY